MDQTEAEAPKFHKDRHIRYFTRCFRTLLPHSYTATDSSRMTLGFFILSGLDLLGVGADTFTESERARTRAWILACQHPHGGFCGSPAHRYPDSYYADIGREGGPEVMDPANLPATCFALLALSFFGGFEGVDRRRCLKWLRGLQRGDGSFGELVTREGVVMGGKDMRYCFVAVAVRWLLRGEEEGLGVVGDIDVEGLVGYLRDAQTYDGGIAESSQHEAHGMFFFVDMVGMDADGLLAGYMFCAIACLKLLDRLTDSPSISPHTQDSAETLKSGLPDIPAAIRWLVSRQVDYIPEKEDEDEDVDEDEEVNGFSGPTALANGTEPLPSHDISLHENLFVGFNGRCNKPVDTCYAFWVMSSLSVWLMFAFQI